MRKRISRARNHLTKKKETPTHLKEVQSPGRTKKNPKEVPSPGRTHKKNELPSPMQLPRPACGEGAGGGALFNLSPIEDFSLDLSKIAERGEIKSKCSAYYNKDFA